MDKFYQSFLKYEFRILFTQLEVITIGPLSSVFVCLQKTEYDLEQMRREMEQQLETWHKLSPGSQEEASLFLTSVQSESAKQCRKEGNKIQHYSISCFCVLVGTCPLFSCKLILILLLHL